MATEDAGGIPLQEGSGPDGVPLGSGSNTLDTQAQREESDALQAPDLDPTGQASVETNGHTISK